MKVSVYHNVATDDKDRLCGMLDGYEPQHPVTLVAELDFTEADVPSFEPPFGSDSDQAVLNAVWILFNVGDDPDYGTPDPRAVIYRMRRNRSLSVGDVVSIDGRWYACRSVGWESIDPPRIESITLHGTTPYTVSS